jgi:teichuronic acid biosynthesis glycosyltransferase TuaH
MNIIGKATLYLKKYGINKTIAKILEKIGRDFKKFPNALLEQYLSDKIIKQLHNLAKNKDVYVMIPCIDWHIPLFQRPHQIAIELSKRENSFVLFLPDQYRYDNFAGTYKINDNLWLYSIRLKKKLNEVLEEANSVVTFMCWTRQYDLLQFFRYDKLIYEYIDDLTLFYYYTDEMDQIHKKLMQKADLTVCTATKLLNNALPVAQKAILCENAGDYEFFHKNKSCEINPLICDEVKKYSCVIGYYGCLAYWFDYETILEVAQKRPDWLFLFIGHDFDGTLTRLDILNHNNILLIPAQPYKNLPSFVSAFDIETIPFLLNEVTEATSPVKLFEYMASSKPIITSVLPECKKYQSILLYDDAESFILQVEKAIGFKPDDLYYSVLEKEALENTWQIRVEKILNNL